MKIPSGNNTRTMVKLADTEPALVKQQQNLLTACMIWYLSIHSAIHANCVFTWTYRADQTLM